jgi:Flp pilus assembly pilin Flp
MDSGRARSLKRFLRGRSGKTAIEYALLAALIAVVVLLSLEAFGPNLASLFRNFPQDKSITTKP